ncbi:hypothetical protein GCM10027057_19740 [Marisediminicola antarctica]
MLYMSVLTHRTKKHRFSGPRQRNLYLSAMCGPRSVVAQLAAFLFDEHELLLQFPGLRRVGDAVETLQLAE